MIYLDDIGNFEVLRVLINEECGNPKVVVDGREVTRNINQIKKPGVLQACVDVYSVRNAIGKSISSTSIWKIGNE